MTAAADTFQQKGLGLRSFALACLWPSLPLAYCELDFYLIFFLFFFCNFFASLALGSNTLSSFMSMPGEPNHLVVLCFVIKKKKINKNQSKI